jgi:hypothetical protein
MLALCERIGRRAREAAGRGEATFAIPEAIDSIAWILSQAPDPELRAEAAGWQGSGAGYHGLVRLCARTVTALDEGHPSFDRTYREKAQGELEPMLALWPGVIVLPTTATLTPLMMISLRALPVHPLGLATGSPWTDGRPAPPSEFFFHDLDHARFKVREDLRADGIEIPDAYQDGTTVDRATGRHRVILPFARGRIGERLWERAPARVRLGDHLLAGIAALADARLAAAAELLLFEIVHEKSFPLERAVLARELGDEAHLAKLRMKAAMRFFPTAIDDATVAALPAARALLAEALR